MPTGTKVGKTGWVARYDKNNRMKQMGRKEKLNQYAKEMRKQMTPWEGKLWFVFLKNYRFKFKRQVIIDKYIVDFSCNAAKLIVELDGGGHYNPESQKYDMERTRFLEQNGYKVVRILNNDVDRNFRGVCEYIDRQVKVRIDRVFMVEA